MAKINKFQKSGQTIYPLTIPEAVIDSVSGKTQKEVNDEFKDVQDGQLKIKNEVVNGDFSDGTSGWNLLRASDISLSDGWAKWIATGSGGTSLMTEFTANITDKIYVNYTVFSDIAQRVTFSIYNRGGLINGVNLFDVRDYDGAISIFSFIFNSDRTGIRLAPVFQSGNTSILQGIKSPIAINLTQTFGAGNEPTKPEMDELIKLLPNGYFEGEITISQKIYVTWLLNLMRQNRNAIIANGGTII